MGQYIKTGKWLNGYPEYEVKEPGDGPGYLLYMEWSKTREPFLNSSILIIINQTYRHLTPKLFGIRNEMEIQGAE